MTNKIRRRWEKDIFYIDQSKIVNHRVLGLNSYTDNDNQQ